MIEPTEPRSKDELDKFINALISTNGRFKGVEDGKIPKEGDVLKHTPILKRIWSLENGDRPYAREQAG
jgi:glycine cleavage system protein P-like pyridoxal-binding family